MFNVCRRLGIGLQVVWCTGSVASVAASDVSSSSISSSSSSSAKVCFPSSV